MRRMLAWTTRWNTQRSTMLWVMPISSVSHWTMKMNQMRPASRMPGMLPGPRKRNRPQSGEPGLGYGPKRWAQGGMGAKMTRPPSATVGRFPCM